MPITRPDSKRRYREAPGAPLPYRHIAALSRRVSWLEGRLKTRPFMAGAASFERAELEALKACLDHFNNPRKNSRDPGDGRPDLEEPPMRPDCVSVNAVESWVPGSTKG